MTMHGEMAESMIDAITTARNSLACLVADPSEPDWGPALKADNPADARVLQQAYDALTEAMREYYEGWADEKIPK